MTPTTLTRALAAAAVAATVLGAAGPARAQSRAETCATSPARRSTPSTRPWPGTTREAFAISLSNYDRLVTFGRKQLDGNWVFDLDAIRGELAERYEVSRTGSPSRSSCARTPGSRTAPRSPRGREVVPRPGGVGEVARGAATPHRLADQPRPVQGPRRAHDPGHPAEADRLALPNLATVYAIIINSKLAKAHATPEDPWAQAWLKEHAAGSGAYGVDVFKPGEQVVLRRNPDWTGAAPTSRRGSGG